jgi:hypothetical protein
VAAAKNEPTTGDLLKTINHQSAKADSFFAKEACGALRLDSSLRSE